MWPIKLPVMIPVRTPFGNKLTACGKFLDSVIVPICYIDVTGIINGNPYRFDKLAISLTATPQNGELTIRIDFLNATKISNVNIIIWAYSDAIRFIEFSKTASERPPLF